MRPSPRQAELTLHHIEHPLNDTFSDRHCTPSNRNDACSAYFEDATQTMQASETLQEFRDSFSQRYGDANDMAQSPMPNLGMEPETHNSHDPPASETTPQFAAREDHDLLRSLDSYTERSSAGSRNCEMRREEAHLPRQGTLSPYNMHRRSISFASPTHTSMQSLQYPSSRHSSAPPPAAGPTKFAPFSGLFATSAAAKQHRHAKMRFDRHAYNEEDESVAAIEANRAMHVERIYNAMVRGDMARDNFKSVAMKRWIREPHYQSDLVEAFAHKLFDCLLEQAKDGFRGWHHNDYVVDDRKGNDEDRDADCASRLDNIILALEQEKTICEDVMNSACQIRMFVNAPLAYSNRKHQNRIGNSKRPNAGAKDEPDANPQPTKARRTGGRAARGRSSTMSDVAASRDTTPQQPTPLTGLPYFANPSPQRALASSPLARSVLAPRAPSLHAASFGQHQANALSPPAMPPRAPPHAPQLHAPRVPSMPPIQRSPFTPPPLSYGHLSAPATPDEVKPANLHLPLPLHSWQHMDSFGGPLCAVAQPTNPGDDAFFSYVGDWSQPVASFAPHGVAGSANFFEQHPEIGVSLADVEHGPAGQVGGGALPGADFETFWNQQQASYGDLPSEHEGRS